MDLLAHALWTGAGVAALQRRWPVSGTAAAAGVAMSVVPDLAHSLPVLAWVAAGDGTWAQGLAYAWATPSTEPVLPQWVRLWSHHLHCTTHSVLVAAAVTVICWPWRRVMWLPLVGWWLHIVIDVFSHSNEFYPVPLFYPITQRGFGMVAWNTPWFAAWNYGALVAVTIWLWLTRRKGAGVS